MSEAGKLEDMKRALKEKFNVIQDLPGVFFDPFAEMEDNLLFTLRGTFLRIEGGLFDLV